MGESEQSTSPVVTSQITEADGLKTCSMVCPTVIQCLIGKCPTFTVQLWEAPVSCLLDTGSMVRTITSFF